MASLELPDNPTVVDAVVNLLKAETDKFTHETESVTLANKMLSMAVAERERQEQEELARNTYHRTYAFMGEIDAKSVGACMHQFTIWARTSDEPQEFTLVINSPGGELIAGFALYDFLKNLEAQGHTITTHGLGIVASMAAVLLQVGTKRILGPSAFLLLHEGQIASSPEAVAIARDRMRFVEMLQARLLDILAERSTLDRDEIAKRWERKDWWMNAEEALEQGFIDDIA